MAIKGKVLTGALAAAMVLSGCGGNNQEVSAKPAPIVVEAPPKFEILHGGSVIEMQLNEALAIHEKIYQGPNLLAFYDGNELVDFCDGRYTATGLYSGAQFFRLVIGHFDPEGKGYNDTYLLDPAMCESVQYLITEEYGEEYQYPQGGDDNKYVNVEYVKIGDNNIATGFSVSSYLID